MFCCIFLAVSATSKQGLCLTLFESFSDFVCVEAVLFWKHWSDTHVECPFVSSLMEVSSQSLSFLYCAKES